MIKHIAAACTVIVMIVSAGMAPAAGMTGHKGYQGAQEAGDRARHADVAIPADAKCQVCGMFAAKYPAWAATVRFTDGTTSWYDGPKDMFRHYLDTTRYTPGKHQADITALSVKEYYSLSTIDARSAFFVIGSDIQGPMGNELIPFKNEKDALAFKIDHKGKRILRFHEITRHTMKSLN